MGETLTSEIKRVQRLIKILKKLVHEPHGKPAIQDVAKTHQGRLKATQQYLKKLEDLQKERKALAHKPRPPRRKPVG